MLVNPRKITVGQCIVTDKGSVGIVVLIRNCSYRVNCVDRSYDNKLIWGAIFHVLIDGLIYKMLYDEELPRLVECL